MKVPAMVRNVPNAPHRPQAEPTAQGCDATMIQKRTNAANQKYSILNLIILKQSFFNSSERCWSGTHNNGAEVGKKEKVLRAIYRF
jgi:hypothetical protein